MTEKELTAYLASVDTVPEPVAASEDYDLGFAAGYDEAVANMITDVNRDRAARYLYRVNAPIGEDVNEWERVGQGRKAIYVRSVDEITKLYMGWDR